MPTQYSGLNPDQSNQLDSLDASAQPFDATVGPDGGLVINRLPKPKPINLATDYDWAGAYKAGLSNDQILNGLNERKLLPFDYSQAKKLNISPDQIADFYNKAPPAPEPSSLARRAIGDTALSLGSGVIGLGQTAYGIADAATFGALDKGSKYVNKAAGAITDVIGDAITGGNIRNTKFVGENDDRLSQSFNAATKAVKDNYTPEQQAAFDKVEKAKGFFETAYVALQNPSTIFQGTVESLPVMATMAGGLRAVALKMGEAAMATAADAGLSAAAQRAAAEAAITKWSTGLPGIGVQAASDFLASGAQQSQQTKTDVLDMDQKKLETSPEYQRLIARGKTPQEAREMIADNAQMIAFVTSGALSAAASPIGSGVMGRFATTGLKKEAVDKALGFLTPKGAITGTLASAGKEFTQEALQSAGEQIGSNVGMLQADPNQDLMEKVGNQAAIGGLSGAAMGAGMHMVSGGHGSNSTQATNSTQTGQTADAPPTASTLPLTGNTQADIKAISEAPITPIAPITDAINNQSANLGEAFKNAPIRPNEDVSRETIPNVAGEQSANLNSNTGADFGALLSGEPLQSQSLSEADRRTPEGDLKRKEIEQMTPAELGEAVKELRTKLAESQAIAAENDTKAHTSPLSGLKNLAAFERDQAKNQKPIVTFMDADSLKALNTAMGEGTTDEFIRASGVIMQQAADETGSEAYHRSGDEFLATHDSPAQADAFRAAQDRIAKETILHFTAPSGEKFVYHQPKFSVGTGSNIDAAERDAKLAKQLRLESGERSGRDQPPPGFRQVFAAGNKISGNEQQSNGRVQAPVSDPAPTLTPAPTATPAAAPIAPAQQYKYHLNDDKTVRTFKTEKQANAYLKSNKNKTGKQTVRGFKATQYDAKTWALQKETQTGKVRPQDKIDYLKDGMLNILAKSGGINKKSVLNLEKGEIKPEDIKEGNKGRYKLFRSDGSGMTLQGAHEFLKQGHDFEGILDPDQKEEFTHFFERLIESIYAPRDQQRLTFAGQEFMANASEEAKQAALDLEAMQVSKEFEDSLPPLSDDEVSAVDAALDSHAQEMMQEMYDDETLAELNQYTKGEYHELNARLNQATTDETAVSENTRISSSDDASSTRPILQDGPAETESASREQASAPESVAKPPPASAEPATPQPPADAGVSVSEQSPIERAAAAIQQAAQQMADAARLLANPDRATPTAQTSTDDFALANQTPEQLAASQSKAAEDAKKKAEEKRIADLEAEQPLQLQNEDNRAESDTVKKTAAQASIFDQAPQDNPAPAPQKVGNFGEELPPPRRAMAKRLSEDLTDNEIASMPFSKLWPQSEVDAITDIETAALVQAARDIVPSKPRTDYKLRRWVEDVKRGRTMAQEAAEAEPGHVDRMAQMATVKGVYSSLTSKFFPRVIAMMAIPREQWSRLTGVEVYPDAYRYDAGKQIPTPHAVIIVDGKRTTVDGATEVNDAVISAIGKRMGVEPTAPKMKFEVRGVYADGKYHVNYAGDSERRMLAAFPDAKAGLEYVRGNYDNLVSKWEEIKARDNVNKADVRNTENRGRVGTDFRNGKDATAEQFESTFGFRGGEFGKWVNQGAGAKERQGLLNQTYDAFMDLATLLDIPPKAISLNGSLGIAFGSRGSGSASAHFEPSNLVINLTKTRGAGTLAHEWFHALDNYFARQRNDGQETAFTGDQAAYRRANYITYVPEPVYVNKSRPNSGNYMTAEQLKNAREQRPNSTYYAEENWIIDPNHKQGVRPEVEKAFAELVEALNKSPMKDRAAQNDKGADGYWSRIIERGARSFENYVIYKLEQRGQQNDFLANVKPVDEFSRNKERYPYLMEQEIPAVAEKFDAVFNKLETKETDKGTALFNRGESTASITPAEAKASVATITSKWKNAPKINVWESFDQAPKGLQDDIEQAGAQDARGAWYGGEIHLFPQNIADAETLERVIIHEARHAGLEGVFGKDLNSVLTGLYLNNESLRKEVNELKKTTGLNTATQVNEILADKPLDYAQKLSGWTKVVGKLKQWFEANGFDRLAALMEGPTGDQILKDVLYQAQEFVRSGKPATTLTDSTLFSRAAQTASAAFKKWFGDSKVVDENGEPLMVYHGTRTKGEAIDSFDIAKAGKQTDSGWMGKGFYFGSKDSANVYAGHYEFDPNHYPQGGAVYPVYLSLQKPAILTDSERNDGPRMLAREIVDLPDSATAKEVRDALIDAGYDGVIYKRNAAGKSYREYVAFRPEQIKSATGNNGSFDGNNPNVLYSRGDKQPAPQIAKAKDAAEKITMRKVVNLAVSQKLLPELLKNPSEFNLLNRTVNTQLHKALKLPETFGKVFWQTQKFVEDIAQFAHQAATLAPELLPNYGDIKQLTGTLRDVLNPGTSKKRNVAISEASAALLDGTTLGGPSPLDGKVFSDAELKARGMSDLGIQFYHDGRKVINKSLDDTAMSEVVRMIGEKIEIAPQMMEFLKSDPLAFRKDLMDAIATAKDNADENALKTWEDIEKRAKDAFEHNDKLKAAGYAPLQRFGKLYVTVTDTNGNTEYRQHFENRIDQNVAVMDLKKKFPGATVTTGTISEEDFKLFKGMTPETILLFSDKVGLDSNLKDAAQQYYREVVSNRSTLKRQLERKGTAGFSDDITRILAGFITSNARRAAMNYNMPSMKQFAQDIPKEQGDIKDEALRLIGQVENPTEDAAALRGLMYTYYIGGSIASALVNFTQPMTMTLPYLGQFGNAKAAGAIAAAMRPTSKLSPTLQAALQEANAKGITDSQEIHYLQNETIRGISSNKTYQKAMGLWGSVFGIAENINRRTTFLAAFEMWENADAETRKQMTELTGAKDGFDFGKRTVQETQGIYNKAARPNIARGAVGATVFTFKQYSVSYLELLSRLPTKQKAVMLAMLVLMGGMGGLPFEEDLEDLIDTIGQMAGYNTNSKLAIRKLAMDTLGKEIGPLVMQGVSGASFSPVDFGGRMGMANLLPATGLLKRSESKNMNQQLSELFGPLGGLVKSAGQSAQDYQDGDTMSAVLGMAPTAVNNLYNGIKIGATGKAMDHKNRTTVDGLGLSDAFFQSIGFNPKKKADDSRISSLVNQDARLIKDVEANITQRLAEAIMEGDENKRQSALDELSSWNSKNPDTPIRFTSSQIMSKVKQMIVPREQRLMKTLPKEVRGNYQSIIQDAK